jgi:hypothetical protein
MLQLVINSHLEQKLVGSIPPPFISHEERALSDIQVNILTLLFGSHIFYIYDKPGKSCEEREFNVLEYSLHVKQCLNSARERLHSYPTKTFSYRKSLWSAFGLTI